ncbi:hypothetical protein HHI36_022192 [Cryptolaemus montrouzieri]|uniref:Ig-like domain-containing protein n=1 Tax=Cryptolaemus montrouzieri TaxID=559131 RepID=A0ABD2MZW0_9CUCU
MIKMLSKSVLFSVLLIVTSCVANQEIEDWTKNCKKCSCKWLNGRRAVNCSNLKLDEIPSDLSVEIADLDLSYNPIHELSKEIFMINGLINLRIFRCHNCSLSNLNINALRGLDILIKLDLSKNNLDRINGSTFQFTEDLIQLNLSFNKLTFVDNDFLSDLINLREILLNDNEIEWIGESAFKRVPALRLINLANNRLKRINTDVFKNLQRLRTVDLQGNPWICDCQSDEFRRKISEQGLLLLSPSCAEPSILKGKTWSEADIPCDRSAITSIKIVSINITLSCEAIGFSGHDLYWMTDGKIIGKDDGYSFPKYVLSKASEGNYTWNNLTITNVADEYQREYKCAIQNSSLSNENKVILVVKLL